MQKRSYQPKKQKRQRKHGFMARNNNHAGKLVLKRRILRGRKKISL